MGRLTVFNNISLDGYFTDANGDMSWAHQAAGDDAEFRKFTIGNAERGEGTLLFGRKTFELMQSAWTSAELKQAMPEVARAMTRLPKVVFSRSLQKTSWENTTLLHGELAREVAALKARSQITIMGSGTLVAQLAREGLIDRYTFVLVPVIVGSGRTLFEGLDRRIALKRINERSFANGIIVATYEPA